MVIYRLVPYAVINPQEFNVDKRALVLCLNGLRSERYCVFMHYKCCICDSIPYGDLLGAFRDIRKNCTLTITNAYNDIPSKRFYVYIIFIYLKREKVVLKYLCNIKVTKQ